MRAHHVEHSLTADESPPEKQKGNKYDCSDAPQHFLLDFTALLDVFKIFANKCYLLRDFGSFLRFAFLPLSCFLGSKNLGTSISAVQT